MHSRIPALALLACSVNLCAAAHADWEHAVGVTAFVFGMEGDTGVKGRTAPVDLSMGDVVDHLDGAYTGLLLGDNGQWGYWASYEFMRLQADADRQLVPALPNLQFKGDLEVESRVIDGGLSYHVPGVDWLELLAGVRIQNVDQQLQADLTGPIVNVARDVHDSENWTNAIVGVRATFALADCWTATVRLDGGAGDSDSTWQAVALLNRNFAKRWTTSFGYRYLKDDYSNDGFVFDMEMSGVEAALLYRF